MPYFLKRKDRFGRIIIEGVGMILHFPSGEILKESAPSKYGNVRYFCKIAGGTVKTGEDTYHRERYTFYIWNNHPCSEIVKNLNEYDYVRICGIYESEYFISSVTNTRKLKKLVKIEYIEPFGNSSGSGIGYLPTSSDTEGEKEDPKRQKIVDDDDDDLMDEYPF